MTVDEELRAVMQTLTEEEADELEQMMSAPADRSAEERIAARVTALAAAPIEKRTGRMRRRAAYFAGTAAACLAALVSVVMYQRTRLAVPESVPPGTPAVTGTMTQTDIQNDPASGSGSVTSAEAWYTQTGMTGSSGAAVTTQTTAEPTAEVSVTAPGSGSEPQYSGYTETGASESGGQHTEDGGTGILVPTASTLTSTTTISMTTTTTMTTATTRTTPVQPPAHTTEDPPVFYTTTLRSSTTWYWSTTTATSATGRKTVTEPPDTTTASETTEYMLPDERRQGYPESITTASPLT
ncbi:MAG: hypothetical protein IJ060_08845 [Oscillospiraceae bacterium]|nr:hypothetical protein [Oscillospiraceae bacterium]